MNLVGTEISFISPTIAGVPRGAILSLALFNIYTADQPITPNTSIAEYADDKTIFTCNAHPKLAASHLQIHFERLPLLYSEVKN